MRMVRRWLPTFDSGLLGALLGTAVAIGVEKAGLVHASGELAGILDPCFGLLVGSIVKKPKPQALTP